jgi:hypothetical protein
MSQFNLIKGGLVMSIDNISTWFKPSYFNVYHAIL